MKTEYPKSSGTKAAPDDGSEESNQLITLSKLEFPDALENCKVGVPERLEMTLVPTEVSDTEVTGTVKELDYAEEPADEGGQTEEGAAPAETEPGQPPKALRYAPA